MFDLGGFIPPMQGGYGQPVMNLGGGGGFGGFNRWGNTGMNYQSMNGYMNIDYSGGWNPNYHDQLLRTNIDAVYSRYDMNFSGQL